MSDEQHRRDRQAVDDGFGEQLGWRLLSGEDRQREYSPSSCVGGDIEPYLAEYANGSEAARQWCRTAGLGLQLLEYGAGDSNTIDLVMPDADDAAIVVFIHGGYWQQLSKLDGFAAAADLLPRGIGYASVDYTLAPAASLSQIVAECRAALALIHTKAAALGIDPDRIFVAGSSAGAHLAAMVGLDPHRTWNVAGLVLLSGVYELEPLIGTTVNDAVRLDLAAANQNSPARLALRDIPPVLISWGENETDQFKRQSRLFAQLLAKHDQEPVELEVPLRNHFDIVGDLGREGTSLGRAVLELIESNGTR